MKTQHLVAGIIALFVLSGYTLGQNGWTDDDTVVHLTTLTDSVGIGTETPSQALEIAAGQLFLSGIAPSAHADATRIGVIGEYDASIKFFDEQAEAGQHFKLTFDAGSQDFRIHSDNVDNILYLEWSGNVGIGTDGPLQALEVNAASGDVEAVVNADASDGDATIRANERHIALSANYGIYIKHDGGTNQGSIGTASGGADVDAIKIARGGTTVEFVGNVGIGTANPGSYELAVNGEIRAKEVVVETGWPDHVFADDYPLMPLHEVAAYIKAHRHLPDMPSASEVAENGVSLGDMQARLLQKVEELTLYVIELHKENEALKARVAELER